MIHRFHTGIGCLWATHVSRQSRDHYPVQELQHLRQWLEVKMAEYSLCFQNFCVFSLFWLPGSISLRGGGTCSGVGGGTGVRGHLTYKKNNYCPSGHSFLIHCRPSMYPSAGRALHTLGRNFFIAPLGTPSWYIVGLACTPVLVGHFILWGENFLLPLWALLPDTL